MLVRVSHEGVCRPSTKDDNTRLVAGHACCDPLDRRDRIRFVERTGRGSLVPEHSREREPADPVPEKLERASERPLRRRGPIEAHQQVDRSATRRSRPDLSTARGLFFADRPHRDRDRERAEDRADDQPSERVVTAPAHQDGGGQTDGQPHEERNKEDLGGVHEAKVSDEPPLVVVAGWTVGDLRSAVRRLRILVAGSMRQRLRPRWPP